jgi:hypothetical protein
MSENKNIFEIKEGDVIDFYWAKLNIMGGTILSWFNIQRLVAVITQKDTSNKMYFGYYPENADFYGSFLSKKPGEIWLNDPHFNEKNKHVNYFNTERKLFYELTEEQANYFNKLFNGEIKNEDMEQNILIYKTSDYYCVNNFNNTKNCISWFYNIFPSFDDDINGTPEERFERTLSQIR